MGRPDRCVHSSSCLMIIIWLLQQKCLPQHPFPCLPCLLFIYLAAPDLCCRSWDLSLVAQLVKNLPAMQETWVGKIPGRRESLPTTVFWPGEFCGLYSPWGCKESDTTEQLGMHTRTNTKKKNFRQLVSIGIQNFKINL